MRRYNLTAHIYESRYSVEQEEKIEAVLENLELRRKCSILDIGCGTGLLFPHLQNSPHLIVGLDSSKEMLEKAEHAKKHLE
ncbi:methyltransferase domain-containing protein, partial [Candidatus Bathyarchaeota archaeon]|nr:methyltransferase domain-containing protein [Candidatus Bathyarchaeota archaeon]